MTWLPAFRNHQGNRKKCFKLALLKEVERTFLLTAGGLSRFPFAVAVKSPTADILERLQDVMIYCVKKLEYHGDPFFDCLVRVDEDA